RHRLGPATLPARRLKACGGELLADIGNGLLFAGRGRRAALELVRGEDAKVAGEGVAADLARLRLLRRGGFRGVRYVRVRRRAFAAGRQCQARQGHGQHERVELPHGSLIRQGEAAIVPHAAPGTAALALPACYSTVTLLAR